MAGRSAGHTTPAGSSRSPTSARRSSTATSCSASRLAAGTLSADRTGLVQARLTVLRRGARRSDLTPHERAVVAAAIERERRDLAVRLARAALDGGGWEARRRSVALVLGRGFGARTRAGALAAIVSPRMVARRRMKRSGTTEIGSGLRLAAPEVPQDDEAG